MKSKKFVLAALALLAITGLLALAGCKNDSVSETPKYTVTFNTDGGSTVVSQTVESGQKAKEPAEPELEGSWFLGWYSDEGLSKKFDFNTSITTATTVYAKWSYKLHTKPTTLTNYTNSHAPEGEWTYVEFGDWPQTILKGDVNVYEDKSKQMEMFTYYLGSDDNYYVKHSDKYYKVEPIVWRVLNKDYASTGNALLLAEKILTGGIPYYVDLNKRTITGAGTKEGEPDIVYPNNWQYSTIRAWLNGLDVVKSDDPLENDKTYTNNGFLQTAFTADAQSLIAATTVDNSAASTIPLGITDKDYEWFWNSGENPYASDTPTKDKIFLLSEQEATNSDYGFDEYDRWVGDDYGTTTITRIRDTTDYAEATGAYPGDSSAGYGGWWWLRSPNCVIESYARDIDFDGYANGRNDRDFADYSNVYFAYGGVVPALSISLQ